jgi:hypothetical protein
VGYINSPLELLNKIRGELAQRNPVVIGMRATNAFQNLRNQHSNALLASPGPICSAEECGHAITVVGYDDRRQAIKIINSWGEEWAEQGFAWISYEAAKLIIDYGMVMRVTPPPPPPPPPATCSLSVQPSSIVRGGKATIAFASSNASGGFISGVGVVKTSGSEEVAPLETTTFVGTFAGTGGNATCASTLMVKPPPIQPPVIVSFKASPEHIVAGQQSNLSWTVTGSTSTSIDNGLGLIAGSTASVSPSSSTVFTMTAINNGGSTSATAQVIVDKSSPFTLPEDRCGKIELVSRAGKPTVTGYVGQVGDLDWLKLNSKGAEIDVDLRPWPQCEALKTLDSFLARGADQGLKVNIRKPFGGALNAGDQLLFEIQTPSFPSFVHVAYIQADGSVVNLTKKSESGLALPRPPLSILSFGTGGEWGKFSVSAPFGREMLVVLAGRNPIFSTSRPDHESEREFLTALRYALLKDDQVASGIVAGFDVVVTTGRQ